MTDKVGIKGQAVIPRAIRDEIKALRGAWADSGGGTDELLEERRRERELEERKAQGWGVGRTR